MANIITKVYETRAGISVEVQQGEETTTVLFAKDLWLESGFEKGQKLTKKELDSLFAEAEFSRCLARALTLLAQSDYSVKRLIVRLRHYEFDDEVSGRVAEYCVKKGYINEEEQCRRIVKFHCIRKHWGKKRIAAELIARGYDRTVLFEALDILTDEEVHRSLMAVVSQKYAEPAEDKAEKEKRIAALARLGYSYSEISSALDEAEEIFRSMEETL